MNIRKLVPVALIYTFVWALIPVTSSEASIMWDYVSTDGTTTVTGVLTTGDGIPFDGGDIEYRLESIDSAAVNGLPVTDWISLFGATPPPFTSSPQGSIQSSDGGNTAVIFSGNNFITVGDAVSVNYVTLTKPGAEGFTEVARDGDFFSIAIFQPTSTTFALHGAGESSVPEPSSVVLLGFAAAVGSLAYRKRKASLVGQSEPNSPSS